MSRIPIASSAPSSPATPGATRLLPSSAGSVLPTHARAGRVLLTMLLVGGLAACVSAPNNPASDATRTAPAAAAKQPGVTWKEGPATSYESRSPGLGSSQRFSSDAGWADVFVYDLRRRDWQTGVADRQFPSQFNSTVDEIRVFGRLGRYADLTVGAERDETIAGQVFRRITFDYVVDGKPIRSATYLTARNGRLLKFRISLLRTPGVDYDALAREFVEANLRTEPGMKHA